ncbi:hypothetical protein [Pedobacter sp. SL55]|uniref:hypothetical protein n=1 Tax=Pedobacter sp. SL55 TaxID=2995161 RepID=UPI002270848C|nr:hypothetical protein [Pedobacter sp. SL55]WAC42229.1 hypothetical protein OVA16_07705 [Pedobacter sp. SL55]
MACAKTTTFPKHAIPASEILEGKTKQGIALTFKLTPTSKKAERSTNSKYHSNIHAPFSCASIAQLVDLQQNIGSLELLVLLVQAKRTRYHAFLVFIFTGSHAFASAQVG